MLPQNFDAPYRATSLREFWRRWHMTLSRFLRDYLYIPLGGNRHGLPRQVWPLFATMALGGLWHGAGLTFVAWGVAHGVGLGAGVLWRRAGLRMPAVLGWALTMSFVTRAGCRSAPRPSMRRCASTSGLFGLAPLGIELKWRAIAFAAAVAVLGPTSWAAIHRLPPWRSIAIGFAVLFVLVLFKIGDDANMNSSISSSDPRRRRAWVRFVAAFAGTAAAAFVLLYAVVLALDPYDAGRFALVTKRGVPGRARAPPTPAAGATRPTTRR